MERISDLDHLISPLTSALSFRALSFPSFSLSGWPQLLQLSLHSQSAHSSRIATTFAYKQEYWIRKTPYTRVF